jgi:hypothetical protein
MNRSRPTSPILRLAGILAGLAAVRTAGLARGHHPARPAST